MFLIYKKAVRDSQRDDERNAEALNRAYRDELHRRQNIAYGWG